MNRGNQLLDKGGTSAVANTCGITGRPDKVLQDRPANRADDHARLPLAIREAEACGPLDADADQGPLQRSACGLCALIARPASGDTSAQLTIGWRTALCTTLELLMRAQRSPLRNAPSQIT